jgi:hypothetical protein
LRPFLTIACAALLLAGCGNTDNQVLGGVLATVGPNAIIDTVVSSINGPATATDQDGNPVPTNVTLMTDHPGLCASLAAHPDYLQTPPEPYVALLLLTPQREVGTYYLGQNNISAVLFTTAGPGNPIYAYPGVPGGGSIGIGDLNSNAGGGSDGNFSIELDDASGNLYSVYGQFKTTTCTALAQAYIPIF